MDDIPVPVTVGSSVDIFRVPPWLQTFNAEKQMRFDAVVEAEKYRTLYLVARSLDLTFDEIVKKLTTHTIVHPEFARILLENTKIGMPFVMHDFVPNTLLLTVMRNMHESKIGFNIDEHLAVDGLGGFCMDCIPNFKHEMYLHNLRYSQFEDVGFFDQDKVDILRRSHVRSIRALYISNIFKKLAPQNVKYAVYQVMHNILMLGESYKPEHKPIDPPTLTKLSKMYVFRFEMHADDEYNYRDMINYIKAKMIDVANKAGDSTE